MVRPLIVVVLFGAAAVAQIRGVPPSVTSITTAPDGRPVFRGVPPSVMSLGPEGFGPSLSSSRFSQHKFSHRGIIPVWFPMFYAVPYVLVERERVIEREVPVEVEAEEPRPRRSPRRSRQEEAAESEDDDELLSAAPVRTREPEAPREFAPTLLVFRDGSRSEVRNFAIVGDALLVFAPDAARKVLLAELDLEATRAVNEARGLAFVVPE